MKKKRGLLFVVSGPSGTGKGTICDRLRNNGEIELSVSMTTRQPRPGEVEGESYYFVSRDVFQRELSEGGLLEYAEVYGNYYGTPKKNALEKLDQGIDLILEIDMQGALKIREAFPEGVFIFVLPPSLKELQRRISNRGAETQEAIALRMGETLKELKYLEHYDYYVVNENLADAVDRVRSIIIAEHSKVAGDVKALIERYKEEKSL